MVNDQRADLNTVNKGRKGGACRYSCQNSSNWLHGTVFEIEQLVPNIFFLGSPFNEST